ncbi:MAG: M3 family metallopeptidase [Legionellales bacterium]|nr:M3 family metallopeptidase [Legionellales bacterium]
MNTSKKEDFPVFSNLDIKKLSTDIQEKIQNNKTHLEQILNQESYTWENLIRPLEKNQYELNCMWSVISHLHSVKGNDLLRDIYKNILPIISEYYSILGQNKKLYLAMKEVLEKKEILNLNNEQVQYLKNEVRDFRLSGVELAEQEKQRFVKIQIKLSELANKFKENVLDSTQQWNMQIHDEKKLLGLTNRTLQEAKQLAQQYEKDGFVFNLDYPSYIAIIRFAKDRELRKKIYQAYSTRASELSDFGTKYDNSMIIKEIVNYRTEVASLLGFKSYAELSLETKMCKSTTQVLNFLDDLLEKSRKQAMEEFQKLDDFARKDGIEKLCPWDIEYYRELYKTKYLNISQEEIREFFPVQQVLSGLFNIVKNIFGLNISEISKDTWHQDVKIFAISDANGNRGYIYADLFARQNKQSGAWMDECRTRFQLSSETITTPMAYLTCNFTSPIEGDIALLTHEEVVTLFHEFGHCLHHILTKIGVLGVSGINGVAWDAVELPSQLLENWCWEYEAISMCSKHYTTGDILPKEVFNRLLITKNYHSAMNMLRQLEFAIFDFKLHMSTQPVDGNQIQEILNQVRRKTAIYQIPDYNKFQNSFSHIFAGGYAAGYYSYKWAEVLSCDAFDKFKKEGIFNKETGSSFMKNILEMGGSINISDLYKLFRGREPKIEPLLMQSGIKY